VPGRKYGWETADGERAGPNGDDDDDDDDFLRTARRHQVMAARQPAMRRVRMRHFQ
jgi:hypothetical protein